METKTSVKASVKTSFKTRLAYAASEVGNQLSFYMISTYLTLFYTDAVGLAPAVVSILMLVVRVIEALSAPILGGVIDQTRSPMGKCRPWIIRSLPFLVLFSILTFSKFGDNGTFKILYAFITYICLAVVYSLITGAAQTMANTLTPDSQERAVLNSWKNASGSITGIVLAAVTMPLIIFFGNDASAYFKTNILYAAISIPMFLITFYFCKEDKTLVSTKQEGPKVTIKDSLLSATHNGQVLSLMVYNVLTLTATFSRIGIMTYYYIYTIGVPKLMGQILMGFQIGQAIPPFIVPFMVKHLGKKKIFFIANIGQAISLIVLYFTNPSNLFVVYVATFFLGFFMMNGLCTFNATSDCIEYEFYKTGKLSPGSIVGAVTLSVKVGLALGGSLGIFMIGLVGYHAGVTVTPSIQHGINMVVNIFPAILFIVALVALIPYKLSNEKVAEIQKANMEKMAKLAEQDSNK